MSMSEDETSALPVLFERTPAVTTFDIVRRGYDRGQVDSTLAGLRARVEELEVQVQSQDELVTRLKLELARAATPSYESLGKRVTDLLNLAQEEAAHQRETAASDAEAMRQAARDAADSMRADAERDALALMERTRARVAKLEEHERAQLERLAAVRDTLAKVTGEAVGAAPDFDSPSSGDSPGAASATAEPAQPRSETVTKAPSRAPAG